MKSLKHKTIEDIGYNSVAKSFSIIIQAVANIILTRILLPSDYGIVGFAAVLIAFLNQFSDIGINSAAIRRKELSDAQLYTGFTLKLIMSISLFGITILFAPLAKYYFDNHEIVNVIKICSIQYLFVFFQFIPMVILTRELNFKAISIITMVSNIGTSLIAIVLAYCGFNFWSLVIANLFTIACSAILMNIVKPKKIKLYLDRSVADEFLRFGSNLFFTGLIAFIILNVNNLTIGAVKGATTLGYYSLAWNWGSMMFTLFTSVIISVLIPTFSKFQDNRPKMKTLFLQGLSYTGLIVALVNTTLIVTSFEFLTSVLGGGTDKWVAATACFQIFCVYGIFRTMIVMVAPVFMGVGNSRIFLKSDALVAIVQLSLVYPALYYFDIEGLAALLLGVTFIQLIVYVPGLRKEIDVRGGELFAATWPALLSAVIVLIVFGFFEISFGSTIVGFLLKAIISSIFFIFIHTVATRGRLISEIKVMLDEMKISIKLRTVN